MKAPLLWFLLPLVLLAQPEDSEIPYHKKGVPWKREFGCKADPLPAPQGAGPAVSYLPAPKPQYNPVTIRRTAKAPSGAVEHRTFLLRWFDFGGISAGPHAGARLLVSKFYFSYKREGNREPREGVQYQRYLLENGQLIRLPSISEPPENPGVYQEMLTQLRLNPTQEDRAFRLAVFEKPIPHVTVKETCVTFWEQLPEETTEAGARVGTHPLYGQFYVADGSKYLHAKLPDGTVLAYYFLPPPSLDRMGGSTQGPFSCFEQLPDPEKLGSTGPAADVLFTPYIRINALKVLRELPGLGKLYVLRQPERVQSYEEYKTGWEIYRKDPQSPASIKKLPLLSRTEFARVTPEFYWQDPFGRWVHFENTVIRFPMDGEPLLYLYPPIRQTVTVRLGSQLRVVAANPPLAAHAWTVEATPEGLISANGAQFGSLFWEGWWAPLAPPDSGFLVRQDDIESFLVSTLDALGLNDRESQEFRSFWVPRMQGHPYYLIAFLPRGTIDAIAPLEITPAPDTLIRVLMDFIPFDHPIQVQTPTLPPKPARTGFVAVEWAGMMR